MLATVNSDDLGLRGLCEEVWARLGTNTRNTFAWPQPGAPLNAGDGSESSPPRGDGEVALRDACFAVLVLLPDAVHELHLGGKQRAYAYALEGGAATPADRLRHAGAGTSWSVLEVNP